jgi:hypothetical protein
MGRGRYCLSTYLETRGQTIRESGDTGDTCPRSLSPKIVPVSAGQPIFGDSGDSEDTFRPVEAVRLVDDPWPVEAVLDLLLRRLPTSFGSCGLPCITGVRE